MKNLSIGLAIGSIGTIVLLGLIGTILVLSNTLFLSINTDRRLDKEKQDAILNEVSNIYLYNTDQQVSVSRISNVESLKGQQAFYENANNGDYLVILSDDKKALIYRNSNKKLINAGPVVSE